MPRSKQEYRRYFSPTSDTAAVETKHGLIIVDAIDADLLRSTGCGHGYAHYYSHSENGKSVIIPLHRVIMHRVTDKSVPSKTLVDHINGNPLDNRRANLRLCTRAENQRNSQTPRNNSVGLKGVQYVTRMGKYRSLISINNTRKHIGYFNTAEEAHAAYVAKARELYGDFANDGNGCLILRSNKQEEE